MEIKLFFNKNKKRTLSIARERATLNSQSLNEKVINCSRFECQILLGTSCVRTKVLKEGDALISFNGKKK